MHETLFLLLTGWLLAHPAGSVSAAACPPVTRVETSWKTVVSETGEYELRLPPTMKPAPPGKYRFIHGGETWEDENIRVSLSFGHWSEKSFEETTGQRCRVTRDKASVFVIASKRRVLAWYTIPHGPYEPVVSATSKVDEPEHLAAIALSLRRRRTAV